MNQPTFSLAAQWCCQGRFGSYVRAMKSPGGVVDLLEVERPAGDISRSALPDIVLYQDLRGGCRIKGDLSGGRFDLGMPQQVYLTRLRIERTCDRLETTDLPVTEIAFEVGYLSNQVLARVFLKHRRMSPTDYRRAVRDPMRQISISAKGAAFATFEVQQ